MPKYDLVFSPPVMNAAGILGFAPGPHLPVELSQFGCFVTNPVSLRPRLPAQGERCLSFPGGFLLHTGYPNPGFSAVLREYAAAWQRATLPVVVHLMSRNKAGTAGMVQQLEGVEAVAGIELGLPPEIEAPDAEQLVRAAVGELPVIARLPLERAAGLAEAVMEAGAIAVSLAPARGALPGSQGGLFFGRLYGPALFPQALAAVRGLAQMGIPVIGAGGIYTVKQADSMLAAGAMAVQLDTVLWRGGWQAPDSGAQPRTA